MLKTGSKSIVCVLAAGACLLGFASPASANWTWNVGYHNPAVSTWGLNLLYIGTQWGFEAGIGWIDAHAVAKDDAKTDETNEDGSKKEDDDKSSARLNVAGDVDLKYFFTSGTFRPFLQAGIGVGIGAAAGDGGGVGAGTGGAFGGIGLLIGSPTFYVYGSYNLGGGESTFVQAGLGFDL